MRLPGALAPLLLAVPVLAACGSLVPTSAAATPVVAEPAARVSYYEACPALMRHGQEAADLILAVSSNAQALFDDHDRSVARVDTAIADFTADERTAPEEVTPQLDTQLATLRELRDYLQVAGAKQWDFTAYKAAGNQIASHCMG